MATINAPCFSPKGFVLLSAPVLWASGFPTAAAPEAGNYYNFRVPITASAEHGENWAATH